VINVPVKHEKLAFALIKINELEVIAVESLEVADGLEQIGSQVAVNALPLGEALSQVTGWSKGLEGDGGADLGSGGALYAHSLLLDEKPVVKISKYEATAEKVPERAVVLGLHFEDTEGVPGEIHELVGDRPFLDLVVRQVVNVLGAAGLEETVVQIEGQVVVPEVHGDGFIGRKASADTDPSESLELGRGVQRVGLKYVRRLLDVEKQLLKKHYI
jgi:hypothetical protein